MFVAVCIVTLLRTHNNNLATTFLVTLYYGDAYNILHAPHLKLSGNVTAVRGNKGAKLKFVGGGGKSKGVSPSCEMRNAELVVMLKIQ